MKLVIAAALAMGLPVHAEDPGRQETKWVNQSGSTMTVTETADGKLSGTYRSALGCGKGVARPLTGWRNGSAWVFSVHFGECGSATSWVGHLSSEGELKTIWTLARGGSDEWNMKLTGTSEFKRAEKHDE